MFLLLFFYFQQLKRVFSDWRITLLYFYFLGHTKSNASIYTSVFKLCSIGYIFM